MASPSKGKGPVSRRRIEEPPPPPPKLVEEVAAAPAAPVIPDGHELVEITNPGYYRGGNPIAVGSVIAVPSGAVAGICDVQEGPGGHRVFGKRLKARPKRVRKPKKEAEPAPEEG